MTRDKKRETLNASENATIEVERSDQVHFNARMKMAANGKRDETRDTPKRAR